MTSITEALQVWLADGGHTFGQILIRPSSSGWVLRHEADIAASNLTFHEGGEAARELSQYTDDGTFRPLKTAPNLRRGWQLKVDGVEDLRRALDYFYPAMLGVQLSHARGALDRVPLRITLARQTGMYRVTQKISDEQAQGLIGDFCRTDGGCLKRILWPLADGQPITTLPAEKFSPKTNPGEWPLLCHEACNLLVAKAREVVKKADSPT